MRAWEAAANGDRQTFEKLGADLTGYELYPYLRYEDLRHRRADTPVLVMTEFLEAAET